jgi:hypothetical protein
MSISIQNHPGFGLTVAQCIANAEEAENVRAESFRRCDTDGFLSQYASNITAAVWREKASIIENQGFARFVVLVDSEGTIVADRSFSNQYGTSWIVFDEHQDRLGRKFIPYDGSHVEGQNLGKSRIQKRLGLRQEFKEAEAWICVKDSTAHAFALRDENKRLKLRDI